METLTVNSKAFIDGFISGLVPCKVLSIEVTDRSGDERVTVRVTAKRHGYNVGDVVASIASRIIPRKSVYRSRQHCGQYRIRPYRVEV